MGNILTPDVWVKTPLSWSRTFLLFQCVVHCMCPDLNAPNTIAHKTTINKASNVIIKLLQSSHAQHSPWDDPTMRCSGQGPYHSSWVSLATTCWLHPSAGSDPSLVSGLVVYFPWEERWQKVWLACQTNTIKPAGPPGVKGQREEVVELFGQNL